MTVPAPKNQTPPLKKQKNKKQKTKQNKKTTNFILLLADPKN